MFKIYVSGAYCIQDTEDHAKFLHSDGSLYYTVEYFHTRELAQAVLDKFYPKPEHVWENGDVFISGTTSGSHMIYMHYFDDRKDQVFSLNKDIGGPAINIDACMKGAKFLFNIKNVIKEKI